MAGMKNEFQVFRVQCSVKRASISGLALGMTTPHPGFLPVKGREISLEYSRLEPLNRRENIQHSTPNVESWREAERLGRSKLGVECFPVHGKLLVPFGPAHEPLNRSSRRKEALTSGTDIRHGTMFEPPYVGCYKVHGENSPNHFTL
jgi:hypothetical protein